MRRATFVLFVSLLAISVFSAPAMAVGPVPPGTYYVDIVNGDNDNDGTSPGTGAWKTLHHAIDQINGGSDGNYTLDVAPGTYEVVDTEKEANTPLNITQDDVTVMGDFISKPILSGPTSPQTGEWEVGLITTGNNITIRDLEIQNFYGWGIDVRGNSTTIYNCAVHDNGEGITIGTIDGGAIKRCEVYNNGTGIGIWDAQNFVVEQNDVHDNEGIDTGILIFYSTTGVVIKKNRVENNDVGIGIYDCSPIVERNEIKDNEIGIGIIGYYSSASPKIHNNLIYDTTSTMYDGIIVDGGYGGTASPELYHNTIDNGLSNGIEMYGGYMGSCTPDILFNIITNFDTYGIYNDDGTPTIDSIDYNDVWHNGPSDPYDQHYYGIPSPTHDIHQYPLYASYGLQSGSPCKDAIPTTDPPNDQVNIDLPGYKRPRDSGYDMGAYEYVADITHNYNLPGGSGQVTDYRMFTIPVSVGSGANMKSTMESSVGTYNKCQWRVFAYDSSYTEMDAAGFSGLSVGPGDAFWAISLGTNLIPFSGRPAPDGEYYTMPLKAGWNMFGLPWPATFPDIELGKIAVSDGVNNYWITSPNNSLTQQYVWDYTGSGPSNGYVQLTAATDVLKPGSGYWINVVESSLPVELLIPPDNGGGYFTAMSYKGTQAVTGNDEGPPPPPGGISSGSSGIHITEKGGCFIATAAE